MDLIKCLVVVCLIWCTHAEIDSNEGRSFAVAFSNCESPYTGRELIINARQNTMVTISTSQKSETITVYENWSVHYDYDGGTVTTDIQERGIYVTSDQPIAVHAAVATSNGGYGVVTPDSVLVRPFTDLSLEYFLTGYDKMGQSNPMAYYMIVATENNTGVDVYYTDNGIAIEDEHITLQRYEVFTRNSYYLDGRPVIDFTGTRVLSNRPVSVYSGIGSANVYPEEGGRYPAYIAESMPTLAEIGEDYTSFPIHFGGDGGYEVRVIAAADDTDVTIPGLSTSVTLNMGEFHVITTNIAKHALKMYCSKPCMAVQYQRDLLEGGETGVNMGAFMAVLIPEERSANSLIFTTPSTTNTPDVPSAISIIINTFPVTGLYLNETSLADLDWQPVEDSSNWFATIEIGGGFYQLYSTEPCERFTAYLYLTSGASSTGFPIGYADVTRPPSGDTPPPPLYRVMLLGSFASPNGEDFTPVCIQGLRDNFQVKASLMIPEINSILGEDVCNYVSSEDLRIVSVATQLFADGTAGTSEASYFLEASSNSVISDLTSCAKEISTYLQDFDNWGRPVIPPAQGCPEPVFDPDYFLDGSTESDWICVGKDEELQLKVDAPAYSLSIYDDFTTLNDEELDASCIQDYTFVWQLKAASMVTTLNDMISTGSLCPGAFDKLSVLASSATFSSQGSEGSLASTFFMKLEYDNLQFDDVTYCVDEMFLFVVYHANWGDLPLLPQQPGCPFLVFSQPQFYHNGESWVCV